MIQDLNRFYLWADYDGLVYLECCVCPWQIMLPHNKVIKGTKGGYDFGATLPETIDQADAHVCGEPR